jgi:hypothetical protein
LTVRNQSHRIQKEKVDYFKKFIYWDERNIMNIEQNVKRTLITLSKLTRVHERKSFQFVEIVDYQFPEIPHDARIITTILDTLGFLDDNGLIQEVI